MFTTIATASTREVSIGRAQVSESPEQLRIVIPAKWSWYTFIVMPAMFLLLAPTAFLIVPSSWIMNVYWVLFFAGTLVRWWLWILAGREVLTVNRARLVLRLEIFRVGWNQNFDIAGVSNLRYQKAFYGYRWSQTRTGAFDYEFLPRIWGTSLSEEEVAALNELIRQRLPHK